MLNYDFFFSVSLNLNLFYNLVISVQSKSFNFFLKNLIFLSKIYLFFFFGFKQDLLHNKAHIVCKFYLFMYFLFSYLKECKISPTIIQLKHAHFKRLICRYKTDL